jgi:F-type H+-transporting ATPase subunit b
MFRGPGKTAAVLLLGIALLATPLLALSAEKAPGAAPHHVFDFWTEFSRVFNFLIVAVLLYFLLAKPIRRAMGGRRERLVKAMREAEEGRAEARRLLEEYSERTAHLERELSALRATAEEERRALRGRILEEARQMAQRVMDQARFTIDQETKKAQQRLKEKAASLALELAEEALRRGLGPEDHRRFLQAYVSKLGDLH